MLPLVITRWLSQFGFFFVHCGAMFLSPNEPFIIRFIELKS